jgi:nitroreductase
VEPEKLRVLLEAVRWAPSCFNEQPWRYLVFDTRDAAALESARSCLVEGNAWARKAPVLLLSVAKENFSHSEKPNRHGQHDVGLASENLVLQATELGLVSHQMAGFDAQKARELFQIPVGYTPMAMIVLGYPGKVEDLPDELQKRETAPRTRKPIEEWAFDGRWGDPYLP